MSSSETRRTNRSIFVRCSEDDYALLEKAVRASMAGAPEHATTTMARFVLTAALEKARALVQPPPAPSGRRQPR